MNIPRMSPGVIRGKLLAAWLGDASWSAVVARQRIAGRLGRVPLGGEGCISIHYVPECHSPNPLTECCTTREEVRCTECHSTVAVELDGVFAP
jgi:hypothetical protein